MDIVKDILNTLGEISKYNLYRTFEELFGPMNVSEELFNPMYIFLHMLIGLLVIRLYKPFFKQSAVLLKEDKAGILKNGIVLYGASLGLIIIFLISITGYGIAMLLMLGVLVFVSLGKIALSIAIGGVITKEKNIYTDMIVGYVIIDMLKLLPYVDWIFSAIIVPILSVGMVGLAVTNLYLEKRYYESPYEKNTKVFDKRKIYGIIVQDKSREEGNNG